MSLATPLAAVTIGVRAVTVSTLLPSGWSIAGRIESTRSARWSGSRSGRLLGDALQGQVGQGHPQLGRFVVAEGHSEVADLADPLGEEVARVGVLRIPVRERGEHHHGVTAVGHDEMETVESEVRGYQSDGQTSNAGGVQSPGVMHPVRDGFGRQRKQTTLL